MSRRRLKICRTLSAVAVGKKHWGADNVDTQPAIGEYGEPEESSKGWQSCWLLRGEFHGLLNLWSDGIVT